MIKTISIDKLRKGSKQIAEGTHAAIYRAFYENNTIAIKVLEKKKLRNQDISTHDEVKIMGMLGNQNNAQMLLFYGITMLTNGKPGIVMEYAENGDLYSFLEGKPSNWHSNPLLIQMAIEMAEGLWFLHTNRVIHRDLKTKNIFLTKDNRIKIGDFGYSLIHPEDSEKVTTNKISGTPCWMAPEILLDIFAKKETPEEKYVYSPAYDVYVLATLIWSLFSRTEPYEDKKKYPVQNAAGFVLLISCGTHENEHIIPDQAIRSIVLNAWAFSPEKRPTAKNVVDQLKSAATRYPS